MKIKAFPFEPAGQIFPNHRIDGIIRLPENAKIVHVGAVPPKGEMFAWAEVSEVDVSIVKMEVCLLKDGDDIPRGYVYRGYILSLPLLFVYEKVEETIIMPGE